MKFRFFTFFFLSCYLLGCSSKPIQQTEESKPCVETNNGSYQAVIGQSDDIWNGCFHFQQAGLFDSVVAQIAAQAADSNPNLSELDELLYFMRAYNYFTNVNALTSKQLSAMADAIGKITKMDAFSDENNMGLRLQEHVFVTYYQYFPLKHLVKQTPKAVEVLTTALAQTVNTRSQQADYRLWELYRSIGFLAYEARGKSEIKQALVAQTDKLAPIAQQLVRHINSLQTDDWRLNNAIWAAANLHYIMNESQQTYLDSAIDQYVFNADFLNNKQQRILFSQNYLVNSFRYHEQCDDDFSGKCEIPTIDDVLPINHVCSDSLFIRAGQMSQEELAQTCVELISQETFFHETIQSQNQPIENDLNRSLRVIIFDNYSEYNRWGQLLFNISTDNGGMYIEGDPTKADNQATFFSFEMFWKRPWFGVWNLNHEYVHYLDGRFVKYGTFGHYPSHVVWWSEGLAEYISVNKQNKKAQELIGKTELKERPSLAQIFATEYKDGSDRVYRWSYLAIRFIFEQYPEDGQNMALYMKENNFEQYQNLLNSFAKQHQQEFVLWLESHKRTPEVAKPGAAMPEKYTPLKLYRYLYRYYLKPEHLTPNGKHKHHSFWG